MTRRTTPQKYRRGLRLGALLYPERNYWRPRTRADCADVPRPCPYVGCRHNLYCDVTEPAGSLKVYWPGVEPGDVRHSCALDLAECGEMTLDDIGKVFGLTREQIRLDEERALAKLRAAGVRGATMQQRTTDEQDQTQDAE